MHYKTLIVPLLKLLSSIMLLLVLTTVEVGAETNTTSPTDAQTLICTTFNATAPSSISNFGTSTINNTIQVNSDIEIADISVEVEITHAFLGDLDANLIAPTGQRITLFDRPGFPSLDLPFGCPEDNMLVSFSTSASQTATALEQQCNSSSTGENMPGPPFAINGDFQPIGDFTNLFGNSSEGTWILEINDNTIADGGRLENWSITVCYDSPVGTPELVNNAPLLVPRGDERTITSNNLLANDAASSSDELTYTISSLPSEGTLLKNGQPLGINATFTQTEINAGLITYTHSGGIILMDNFEFTVANTAGFSLEGNTFQIEITVGGMDVTLSSSGEIRCNGDETASISVTVSGGLPPYDYSLNGLPNQASNQFANLGGGNYIVEVTDQLGNRASSSTLTIDEPAQIVVTNQVLDNDVIVTVGGGTSPYTYQANGGPPQASSFFADLANGDYVITVTDSEGCTATTEATIFTNTVVVAAAVAQQVSCHDGTDGIITALAAGGTSPYDYQLNDGDFQPSGTFSNLPPDTYRVTARDVDGFTRITNILTLNNPPELNGSAVVEGFEITVSASGGTSPLRYQLNNGTIQTSNSFLVDQNGSYTVTVLDANDCTLSLNVNVSVNTLAANVSITQDISCTGADDASIAVSTSGGTPPYAYSLNGSPVQNSPIFTSLVPGTYAIEIVDQEGFTFTTNEVVIAEPAALSGNTIVEGFEITVNANGGTPPLRYQLNDGAVQVGNIFVVNQNGDYVVTVLDANNCSLTLGASVSVNTLAVSASVSQTISCNGAGDARILVNTNGGTPPYVYILNDAILQGSPVFVNLGPGAYSVEVVDQDGFTFMTNEVVIAEPAALNGSTTVEGFDITVTASGGTPPLRYQLNDQAPQSGNVFTMSTNGSYEITVIDANDCELSLVATVSVNTLSANASLINDISCHNANDGSIQVSVSGGSTPYTYSIGEGTSQSSPIFSGLGPGSYVITVFDNEGFSYETNSITLTNPPALSGSVMVDEFNITVMAAGGTPPLRYQLNDAAPQASSGFSTDANGTYSITVLDANDCELSLSATVSVNTLQVSASVANEISCHDAADAQIVAAASGGATPYQYQLNEGVPQVSPVFNNLGPGTYAIVVLDAEGFTRTTNTVTIENPPLLEASLTVDDYEITIDASGGTPPLQYQLNDGSPQSDNSFLTTANGTYSVTVIDANDCTFSLAATVSVNNLMATTVVSAPVSCPGEADGELTVIVSAGTAPFTYQLNEGTPQATPVFSNLAAGSYAVKVTDAEGFEFIIANTEISDPLPITVEPQVVGSTVIVQASGGTGILSYSLDGENFQASNTFPDLMDGTYTIWVTDEANCLAQAEATVASNDLSGILQVVDSVSCFGGSDASIIATISGGNVPYRFSLDGENFQDSNLFEDLPAATYAVVVRDAIGNTFATNTVSLEEPSPLTLDLVVSEDSLLAVPSGGAPPYVYYFAGSPIPTDNPLIVDLPTGTYGVVLEDANGCLVGASADVVVGVSTLLFNGEDIKVYPNPSSGWSQLLFPQAFTTQGRLVIYNELGQAVHEQVIASGSRQLTLQSSNLPAGVYQILLTDGRRQQTVRWVVL